VSKYPRVVVPPKILAELKRDNLTPMPILGDMSAWVSQYSFPYWFNSHEERVITLERRGHVGEDRWAIMHMGDAFNKRTRRWEYEPRPSSRSDRFLKDCRYTLAEARPVVVREVFRLHRHALHKVGRILALREEREAAHNARRTQFQLMANALSAHLTARESQ